MSKKILFPQNFLWGAATSAHQIEGGNDNNDWWRWEEQGRTKECSLKACDSWNRYSEDHRLVEELGCGAFRISLEWSRIEPEEGKFSSKAVEHYRQVLTDLKRRGIKSVVTLWHWTLPLWLVDRYGGWHNKETVRLFVRFGEKVAEELGEEIDFLVVLNEPRIALNKGYLIGEFPPGKRNPWLFLRARKNLVRAYLGVYAAFKQRKKDLPVGLTQFCNDFDYIGGAKILKLFAEQIERFYNWYFFDRIGEKQDFIGINYYNGYDIFPWPPFVRTKTRNNVRSDMEWGFSPEGINELALEASRKYQKPIYIFENGAADAEDQIREKYIRGHLQWLHRAISKGADVRGYFYWSLLDNFEWCEGFWPRFGLVEVDFQSLERKPRPSFFAYQKIIRENGWEQ